MDLLDCIILSHQINRFLNLRIMSCRDPQILSPRHIITKRKSSQNPLCSRLNAWPKALYSGSSIQVGFFVETALARTHRRDIIFEKCRRGLLQEAFVSEGEGG